LLCSSISFRLPHVSKGPAASVFLVENCCKRAFATADSPDSPSSERQPSSIPSRRSTLKLSSNQIAMDEAYNQHSPRARHRGRSSLNLNQLSLAPLTSRFPLPDYDVVADSTQHVSYIEGRSAPTTPSILSRSSSRVSLPRPSSTALPKSRSSTYLLAGHRKSRSVAATPTGATGPRRNIKRGDISAKDRNDLDWLLRAGTSISSSTRESKGQTWLVSRASSTSLSGLRDEDDEEFQADHSREREQASRRGSGNITFDADDEFSPGTTRRSLSFGPAPTGSRPLSRFGSRANSRHGSRAQLFTGKRRLLRPTRAYRCRIPRRA
jgi:hypothetical protein